MLINPENNSSPIDVVFFKKHTNHTINGKIDVSSTLAGANPLERITIDYKDSKNISETQKSVLVHKF